MGIPVGVLVDSKGPRSAVVLGALLLGIGYFFLHQAYDSGSGSVPVLCLFSFMTGLGGCGAFQASIKASALNWPHHRGTATGFPLAAFGLSAFAFSTFSQLVMPGDTGDFLMLLAYGTFGIVVVGFFFLRVLPHSHYSAVPTTVRPEPPARLHRTKSEEAKHRAEQARLEPGRSIFVVAHLNEPQSLNQNHVGGEVPESSVSETDETSSLMSKSTTSGDEVVDMKDHAHRTDIRGFKMLPLIEFWQLFALMGILTGVGLMTIK